MLRAASVLTPAMLYFHKAMAIKPAITMMIKRSSMVDGNVSKALKNAESKLNESTNRRKPTEYIPKLERIAWLMRSIGLLKVNCPLLRNEINTREPAFELSMLNITIEVSNPIVPKEMEKFGFLMMYMTKKSVKLLEKLMALNLEPRAFSDMPLTFLEHLIIVYVVEANSPANPIIE